MEGTVRVVEPAPPSPQVTGSGSATTSAAADSATLMDRYVVHGPRLPTGPDYAPYVMPKQFSLTGGGVLYHKNLGGTAMDAGFWPWTDILAGAGKFQPVPNEARLNFLNFSW